MYNYTTYKTAIQTAIASQSPDADFDTIFSPSLIDYAEQRIYRELNLLNTVQTKQGPMLSVGSRDATIDSTFVVVNEINVLTPAGSGQSDGVRAPLTPVSIDVLNMMFPGNTYTAQPEMFAMVDQFNILVGPSPDQAYNLEVIGTYRPVPLSQTNPTTFLTERLPDLFFAAGMVFASGYLRNFGSQASDPQMAMSWEAQYDKLFESANSEEARKHGWGASWSAHPVAPQAQPQRG